jgi:electron transfer flavoprotein alpha subunit
MGGAAPSMVEAAPHFLTVAEAADRLLAEVGRRRIGMVRQVFEGTISDVASPSFAPTAVVAVLATDAEGGLQPSAGPVLHAVQLLSDAAHPATVLVLVPSAEEEAHRRAAAAVFTTFSGNLVLLTVGDEAGPNMEIRGQLLKECWRAGNLSCQLAVGEPWTETAFAALAVTAEKLVSPAILRVRRIVSQDGRVVLETFRAAGKLVARQPLPEGAGSPCWLTLTADAEVAEPTARPRAAGRVERWSPRLERFYGRGEIQRLLEELKQETGLVRLADAEFVIDVGFGVGNRDGYETVIEPLERALRGLGVRSLTIGGSRKVTEELHLLPADRQIGQSGVSVNPRLLLAIGVSGAPQHMNYIGGRAIVLAFNRDPEAPIMTWNRRQARPRVFPVVGDLFQTVPAFTAVLQAEQPAHPELSSRIVSPAAPR